MFKPSVNEEISLLNKKYVFQPRKSKRGGLYSAEGAKGTVYRLQRGDSHLFAFKVFHDKYRSKELLYPVTNLKKIANFVGLKAADREILSSSEPIVKTHRDLEYAVIMPWITTKTWFEVLDSCSSGQVTLHQKDALKLCSHFLEIMMNLEANDIAHTDLCSRNMMVDISNLKIELIDLEDMYMPNTKPPQGSSTGGDGYFHPKRENLWCKQGDRYATAILATEMLLLSNQNFCQKMQAEGFFHNNDKERLEANFPKAKDWLNQIYPEFAKNFERAWNSSNLLECPKIKELYESLSKKRKIENIDEDPFNDPDLSGSLTGNSFPRKPRPQINVNTTGPRPQVNNTVSQDPFEDPDVTGSLTSKLPEKIQPQKPQPPNPAINNHEFMSLVIRGAVVGIIIIIITVVIITYIITR